MFDSIVLMTPCGLYAAVNAAGDLVAGTTADRAGAGLQDILLAAADRQGNGTACSVEVVSPLEAVLQLKAPGQHVDVLMYRPVAAGPFKGSEGLWKIQLRTSEGWVNGGGIEVWRDPGAMSCVHRMPDGWSSMQSLQSAQRLPDELAALDFQDPASWLLIAAHVLRRAQQGQEQPVEFAPQLQAIQDLTVQDLLEAAEAATGRAHEYGFSIGGGNAAEVMHEELALAGYDSVPPAMDPVMVQVLLDAAQARSESSMSRPRGG